MADTGDKGVKDFLKRMDARIAETDLGHVDSVFNKGKGPEAKETWVHTVGKITPPKQLEPREGSFEEELHKQTTKEQNKNYYKDL